jgi:ankyrin repeat protein
MSQLRRRLTLSAVLIALIILILTIRWRGPYWLAETDNLTVARILLAIGIDGDEPLPGRLPALHVHAFDGHDSMVRLMLDAGANIESRDKLGWAPLHFAVYGGQLTTVELLIERGANVNAQGDCRTPYQVAVQHQQNRIARLLVAHGALTEPPCP